MNNLEGISKAQKQALQNGCPACGSKHYHTVPSGLDDGTTEIYVWCNDCLMSMDSDGGYTN